MTNSNPNDCQIALQQLKRKVDQETIGKKNVGSSCNFGNDNTVLAQQLRAHRYSKNTTAQQQRTHLELQRRIVQTKRLAMTNTFENNTYGPTRAKREMSELHWELPTAQTNMRQPKARPRRAIGESRLCWRLTIIVGCELVVLIVRMVSWVLSGPPYAHTNYV